MFQKTCSNRVRQPCYNHEIHEARRVRCKSENKWQKTGLEVHHQLYLDQLEPVNTIIENAKEVYLRDKLKDADSFEYWNQDSSISRLSTRFIYIFQRQSWKDPEGIRI